ncbi:O-antigen ligase family protein [Stieleria sp. ICT_E10.1]|uniref:O-antigen ligase family protein n=1 Tax=Stieleria sedimenti TaxID=2976331 RepID=UPI0021800F61|nr:O-antigen ligase family protein [Stieleria sedimenti]MCS7469413.1 O-antigen ligase family protein [Stieleria sedimenti]
MYSRQRLSELLHWIAAITFGIAPAMLASDFGGILPWTKYTSAVALTLACSIALLARSLSVGCPGEIRLPPQAFAFTGVLLVLLAAAMLQTMPLPARLVAWLSPASYSAFVMWAGGILPVDLSQSLTISIAPFDSRHAIANLSIAVLVSFFAVWVFHHRGRTTWLLSAIAVGACSVALIGLVRKLFPAFHLWSFRSGGEGAPFGTFLNRNNAALAINLGIASALGLIVYRGSTLSHQGDAGESAERQAGRKTFRMPWLRDGVLLTALVSLCVTLVGLIGCGSRGGLLSMLVAGVATVALTRGNRVRLAGVVAAIAVVVLAVVVVLRTGTIGTETLREDTFQQIGSTVSRGSERLSTDTRLSHWPDGFRTAIEHFPGGSGLASYGYAYLPWQQTSPWRHCLHADNLWLEMFVELGLIGLVLTALVAVLMVQSLRRLYASTDPLDHGIGISGCYLCVVIAVSQTFDFGLILPANLFAVVMLLSVVVARASTVVLAASGRESASSGTSGQPKLKLLPQGVWWRSPGFLRERVFQIAGAAGLLVIAVFAIHRLRFDSWVDFAVRTADAEFQHQRTDQQWLDRFAAETRTLAGQHPHPDLLDVLTRIDFQRGRLLELTLMNAGRVPQAQQAALYAATSRGRRRLAWRAADPVLSMHVTDAGKPVPPMPLSPPLRLPGSPYAQALQSAEASLRQRPLAMPPRIDQVYLEFIHRSPERTKAAIRQSAALFRNTPELQLRFGALAANHGDYATAVQVWRRAATLDDHMIPRVLGRSRRFPDFPLEDLVSAPRDAFPH